MKGHKGKKYGGAVESDGPASMTYAGGDSNVVKAAKERKKGGRVGKDVGEIKGGKSRLRLDRPGRKSGGRVGSNSSPLTSAANTSNAPGRDASECG